MLNLRRAIEEQRKYCDVGGNDDYDNNTRIYDTGS